MKINLPLALAGLLFSPVLLTAQSPVTAFSASYQSVSSPVSLYTALPVNIGAFNGCALTLFTYTFSNGASNQYQLNTFNANGSTYVVEPAASATVRLRRVDNPQVSGVRNIVYMESTASTAAACPLLTILNFKPPYKEDMEALLAGGILNQGTDNVFTNASNGDGNNNNIERVDVLFPSGLNTTSPAQAGFAIFDRGNNFQHDPFRIAAITSMDAQGNPTSFGAVKTCVGGNGSNSNGSWGHPSQANGNKQLASYVLRKDVSDLFLRASSNVNQELGGVFYSFADLGIKAGQALYGYALLGPDGLASPTTAQLLDLGNTAVYPIQTTEAVGGGLDLVAVNTVFQTGSYVVLSTPAAPPSRLPDSAVSFTGWKIYPTMPRQGQELTLQGLHDGVYSVLFYNASGIAYTTSVRVHGETSLAVPAMPGIYWVQVRSADGRLMPGSGKLVIQ